MPRRIMPVSAFGSEIMTALLRAAKAELRIPFPSLDMAMRFRQRIYQLRTAMREEKHRDYAIAASVRIYIEAEPIADIERPTCHPDAYWVTKSGPDLQAVCSICDKRRAPRTIIRLSPADSEFASILQQAHSGPRPPSESTLFNDLLREIESEEGANDGS